MSISSLASKSITRSIFMRFLLATIVILVTTFSILFFAVSGSIKKQSQGALVNVTELVLKIAQTSFEFYQDTLVKDIAYIEKDLGGGLYLSSRETIRVRAQNQISKDIQTITIPKMKLGRDKVAFNNGLVDGFSEYTGNTTTIFQRINDGMLRISTSVRKKDGTRAVGTYIPNGSPVIKKILKGEAFSGRAFVVDQWYITYYKPLYQGKRIIGMLYSGVRQQDVDRLKKKILAVKVGKTGYPFIMDSSGELVIHPTAVGKNISDKPHIKEMLEKKTGTIEYSQTTAGTGQGNEKIVVYRYLPEMKWIIAAGAYKHEFNDALNTILQIVIISIIAAIAVNMIIAYVVGSSIAQPIKGMALMLKDIAQGGGDLTRRIETDRVDEIGELGNWFNTFVDKIESVIAEVKTKTHSISMAIENIASGNQELSSRTTEQAASLEETASSLEEMAAAMRLSAENATRAFEMMEEGKDSTLNGVEVISDATDQMGRINESNEHITNITKLIEDVAFQTNILSLNAAVEAARAGKNGTGFAVVASEVRTLAQNTSSSVQEINKLITDNTQKIIVGSDVVNQAGKILASLKDTVISLADIMNEIKNTSLEHQDGVEQVNRAVSQMDAITQQNASLVEEFAASSQDLAGGARELMTMMNYFRVKESKLK